MHGKPIDYAEQSIRVGRHETHLRHLLVGVVTVARALALRIVAIRRRTAIDAGVQHVRLADVDAAGAQG